MYLKNISTFFLAFVSLCGMAQPTPSRWQALNLEGISLAYPLEARVQSHQFTRTWFLKQSQWSAITSEKLAKSGESLFEITLLQMNPGNKPPVVGDNMPLQSVMHDIRQQEKTPQSQSNYYFPYYMAVRVGRLSDSQAKKSCYINPEAPASMAFETKKMNGSTYHVLHYQEADIGAKSIDVTSYRLLKGNVCYAIDVAQDMANIFEMDGDKNKMMYVKSVSTAYQQLAQRVINTLHIN